MAKPPPGGKPPPAPKKVSGPSKADIARAKAARIAKQAAAQKAATQKASAAAKTGAGAGLFKSPTMGQAFGSTEPTVGTNADGSANKSLLPGATDPFAGTPYAGMSPFQVAQKIVQDEITQQAQAISAQMAQQNQYNQNALSVVSQLGQQLQQGAGQFATNYNASLAGPGGAGGQQGGPGGGPDVQKSFQGFNAGYNAAQGLIANGQGSNPNQPGGPSQAAPLPSGVTGGDAQAYHDTAQSTNPFAVLPAAYGRIATMDANLLAANQAQGMTGYSQAIKDLFAGENKSIFDEFQQLQGLFDSANKTVTDSQAAAAQAASDQATANQKTYEWEYTRAQQTAARLSSLNGGNGHVWLVNPKTNTPYDTGVLTAAAIQAGFKNKVAAQSIADRQRALDQSDARLKETIAHNQAIENNASASLQERRVAQANLQAARRQQQANAAARLKLAQQAAAAKKTAKGSGGAGGKTQVAIGKTVASAAAYATSLGKATVKHGATVNPDGTVKGAGTGPKYTPQKIYQLVYARYSRSLFAYYRQLYPNKPKGFYQPYVDKAIHQAVYGN